MVQDLGLRLLQRQDTLQRGEQTLDSIRLALVASGRREVEDVFPEYFTPEEATMDADTPDDYLAREDVDYDYSGVEWEVPTEDEAALLEQFLEDRHVAVPGSDL